MLMQYFCIYHHQNQWLKPFSSNRLKDFIWCHCLLPYWIWPTYRLSLLFASLPDIISTFAASKSHLFKFDDWVHACPFKTNREETAASRVAKIFCYHSEDQLSHENSWKSVESLFPFALSRPNHSCSLLCMQQKVRHFLFWFSGSEFFFFVMTWKVKVVEQQKKYRM